MTRSRGGTCCTPKVCAAVAGAVEAKASSGEHSELPASYDHPVHAAAPSVAHSTQHSSAERAGTPPAKPEAGVMAPAATPVEIVAKLNTELNALLRLPEVREALAKQGVVPAGGAPERLQQLVANDIARWTKLVASAQIKTE